MDIILRPASPPDGDNPPHPNSVWIPALGWSTEAVDPPLPRRQSLKKFKSGSSLRSIYRKSDLEDIKAVAEELKTMYNTDHKKLVSQRATMQALSKQAIASTKILAFLKIQSTTRESDAEDGESDNDNESDQESDKEHEEESDSDGKEHSGSEQDSRDSNSSLAQQLAQLDI